MPLAAFGVLAFRANPLDRCTDAAKPVWVAGAEALVAWTMVLGAAWPGCVLGVVGWAAARCERVWRCGRRSNEAAMMAAAVADVGTSRGRGGGGGRGARGRRGGSWDRADAGVVGTDLDVEVTAADDEGSM